jgi:hypothetical protein
MDEDQARILILSNRNFNDTIFARCLLYEFEDLILEIDSVDIIAPNRQRKNFESYYRRAGMFARKSVLSLNPGIEKIKVKKKYDLFFMLCEFPKDLLNLNSLGNWREKCSVAICWIDELLINHLPNFRPFFKLISEFDYVITSCMQGDRIINEKRPGKSMFMPLGVDVIKFYPYQNWEDRAIDVLSIGRKSETMHKLFLDLSRNKNIFYYYDSTNGDLAMKHQDHRLLIANLLKRCKFFLVYPGKFDMTNDIGNEEILGARYFEGAAAGAIMIGKAPNNREFKKNFDWKDAVIDICSVPEELNRLLFEPLLNKERLKLIVKTNIQQSLLRHDWVYRWEKVLEISGLKPKENLLKRKTKLKLFVENLETIIALSCFSLYALSESALFFCC